MRVELIAVTETPEQIITAAGRLCYSDPENIAELLHRSSSSEDATLIQKLASMGHLSTFEHVQLTFAVFGISRACSHQLVRHRIASYSQQSQRYVSLKEPDYVVPESILGGANGFKFEQLMRQIWKVYGELVEAGYPAEDARYVLPNACTTKIIISMNARELLHFFSKRCCNRAQWEIRKMAHQMLNLCQKEFPEIFKDAGPSCMTHPCTEGKLSCGKPWKKWPNYERLNRQMEMFAEDEDGTP